MPDEKTPESFSPAKWLSGFLNPVTWSKSFVYGLMIAVIVFAGLTIYRAYFMKTGSNISKPTHTPTNIMLPGSGNIGTLDQSQDVKTEQKLEQSKRPWWLPIPYVSIFGEARGSSKTNLTNLEYGYGAQAGIRWDFK